MSQLSFPRFYPILDTEIYEARGFKPEVAAAALLECGVHILQYRHKGSFTEDRFQEAKRIRELCRSTDAEFVLNDRVDFARLLDCGVHLGQEDLPVLDARKLLGSHLRIGFSTHNEAQVRSALEFLPDYIAIGPIFHTGSKANPDPVLGLAQFQCLRSLVGQPVVAIGGITIDTALSVIDSGADSVAVISGVLPAVPGDLAELKATARRWLDAVGVTSPPL